MNSPHVTLKLINTTITAEIGKIKHEISVDLTTKVANELSSRASEINDKSTAGIGKIKNENLVPSQLSKDPILINKVCPMDLRGSSTNSSSSSPGSSGSSQRFANIISVIREQFSDIFDRIKSANDYSLDQMCAVISVDTLRLGMGVIGKDTIKAFYRGDNIKSENLEKIDAWIDHRHLHHY
ncbi:hypothetical protein C1645_813572 [Glomus cerebriforme]|uniref:Uncharacterized protein n=1 Tax=Glomus cerebriforme TaxID=658196 RepID=A0A397TMZ7_9GLOM|nr:hypothetical protein C1645_813572 [Glomus cerebriforme]